MSDGVFITVYAAFTAFAFGTAYGLWAQRSDRHDDIGCVATMGVFTGGLLLLIVLAKHVHLDWLP